MHASRFSTLHPAPAAMYDRLGGEGGWGGWQSCDHFDYIFKRFVSVSGSRVLVFASAIAWGQGAEIKHCTLGGFFLFLLFRNMSFGVFVYAFFSCRQRGADEINDRGGPVWAPRSNAKYDRLGGWSGAALPPNQKPAGLGGSAPQPKPKNFKEYDY